MAIIPYAANNQGFGHCSNINEPCLKPWMVPQKNFVRTFMFKKKGTLEDIPTNRFESEMIATTRIANLQPRETRHGHQIIARLRRGGNMTSSFLIYKSDM